MADFIKAFSELGQGIERALVGAGIDAVKANQLAGIAATAMTFTRDPDREAIGQEALEVGARWLENNDASGLGDVLTRLEQGVIPSAAFNELRDSNKMKLANGDGTRWITIGGGGVDDETGEPTGGGRRVQIDGQGRIVKGLSKNAEGKTLSEAFSDTEATFGKGGGNEANDRASSIAQERSAIEKVVGVMSRANGAKEAKRFSFVRKGPAAKRIAEEAALGFAAVRKAGISIPDSVKFIAGTGSDVSSFLGLREKIRVAKDVGGYAYPERRIVAINTNFSGKAKSEYTPGGEGVAWLARPKGIPPMAYYLVHEIGHILHRKSYGATLPKGRAPDIAKSLSRYAAKNGKEFVAEAFAAQVFGRKLTPEQRSAYEILKGPEVPNAIR